MPNEPTLHSSCVDAETLAAWSERALSAADAAAVELHLSDCAKCQEVAAAFGRTLDEHWDAHWEAHRKEHRQGLRGGIGALSWWVPLAAAAAILIWIATPRREEATAPTQMAAKSDGPAAFADTRSAPQEPAAQSQQAISAPEAARPGASAAVKPGTVTGTATRQGQTSAPAPPASQTVVNLPPSRRGLPEPVAGTLGQSGEPKQGARGGGVMIDGISAMPPASPAPIARSAGDVLADSKRTVSETVAPPSAAPVQQSAGARAENTFVLSAARGARAEVVEIVSADSSFSLVPQPAGGAVGGVAGGRGGGGGGGRGGAAAGAGAGRGAQRGNPAGIDLPTPTRWRILGPGRAERSRDGGLSWEAITIDPPVTITSGASPSPAVCWLIGPQGVVLLTVDGLHFDRVPFPESTNLSSIRAVDARRATVTTSSGRVFETTDGGASWQVRD